MMLFGKKNKEKKLSKQSSRSDSLDRNQGTQGVGSKPVLGVPLTLAVKNNRSYDGIPIPALVRQCIDYVELEGEDLRDNVLYGFTWTHSYSVSVGLYSVHMHISQ